MKKKDWENSGCVAKKHRDHRTYFATRYSMLDQKCEFTEDWWWSYISQEGTIPRPPQDLSMTQLVNVLITWHFPLTNHHPSSTVELFLDKGSMTNVSFPVANVCSFFSYNTSSLTVGRAFSTCSDEGGGEKAGKVQRRGGVLVNRQKRMHFNRQHAFLDLRAPC